MIRYLWKAGVVVLGALLGYGYYYYVGCRTGTCPITSNPWISTGYGAFFGLVLAWGSRKKQENQTSGEQQHGYDYTDRYFSCLFFTHEICISPVGDSNLNV